MKSSEAKKWGELVHVLGAFTFFIGPLIIYFSQEDKHIRKHCKRALNWQFSFLIYFIVLQWIIFMSGFLKMLLVLLNVVFSIIAFVKASDNILWNYPLSIPFFK